MNIIFHSNQLGIRGTEVNMYNLAKACKNILGWNCTIAARKDKTQEGIDKFSKKFPIILYDNFEEVEDVIVKNKIDWLYTVKGGKNDGVVSKYCKNFVHVVFQRIEPHGDKYVFISEWLAKTCDYHDKDDFLPFIVSLPEHQQDYRKTLDIPKGAIVFGRHGGHDEFNLGFVHDAIKEVLKERDDIYFLFMNTKTFIEHDHVKYLLGTWEEHYVRQFVNTCDYMLHARLNGESFGLAIAEFLFCNKPVITWLKGMDRNHVTMCRDKGIYYEGTEVYNILKELPKSIDIDVKHLVSEFTPEKVVKKFARILST